MLIKNVLKSIIDAALFIFFLSIAIYLPTTVQGATDNLELSTGRDAFSVSAEPVKKTVTGPDQGKYELVIDSETISRSLQAKGGLINLKIEFASGSARLTERAKEQISEIAGALQSKTLINEKIMITGHTDSIGSAKTNLALSRQRALAVKQALVNLRIDKFRLSARGRGESEPLSDNRDAVGRARNRRVTLSR